VQEDFNNILVLKVIEKSRKWKPFVHQNFPTKALKSGIHFAT
jgi:hypothetical protein